MTWVLLNTFKKKRSYSTKYCTLHEKMYTFDYILVLRRESTDVLVIGIDANVQIGTSALRTNGERNEIKNQIVGSHGLPNTCARSETLQQFLLSQQLCALNTFLKKTKLLHEVLHLA